MTTSHWLCARTKHRSEFEAEKLLRKQFDDVYIPRFQKKRRHAGKTDMVERALFPRYVFILVSSAQRWRDICTTPYVERLVCNGDQPAIVGDDDIATLRSRENSDGYIEMDQPKPMRTCDKIKVLGGEFEDFLGSFESLSDHERVAILLDVLGRKTRVELNANLIAAAGN